MKSGKKIFLGLLLGMLVLLVVTAGLFFAKERPGRGAMKYAEAAVSEENAETGGADSDSGAIRPIDPGADTDSGAGTEPGAGADTAPGAGTEPGANTDLGAETKANISLVTEPETSAETEPEAREECVLLFAGDVYLSNHVLNAYDKAGGIWGVLDEGIRAEIEAADIFMVNQEFPFTERGTAAADKQFTFRLPHDRIHIMEEMGIDIVTLANNHILDFGQEGLLDSCAALEEAGILYVGAGENLERAKKLETITVGGRTIGFLGTSRVYMDSSWAAGPAHPGVFSTYDPTQAVEAIREARELCDYLVVYVHWGVERETTPEEYQRTMGRQYIDAGADLVIGSHPHVLQPVEYYNDKPIVYSLGNFVFGSSIPSTELFKVVIKDDGVEITEIPCTSSAGYTRLK